MERTLQEEIADYQQMVETTRQDGRALRHRLEQEGWEIIDSLFELGCIPCAIHPDLWTQLNEEDGISFDDEDGFYYLQSHLTDEEWKMIVELPVIG